MTNTPSQRLLDRLEAIGHSLESSGQALALIGLGSVGRETGRLDEFSDLDFFAIVKPGYKQHFLEDLSWLSRVSPIAYSFYNTKDGCKLLFTDGIFCEWAVFEPAELAEIPFAEGRIVWKALGVPDSIRKPVRQNEVHSPHAVDWLLGECLTCLYVGLGRYRRGEKLSAMRFVQGYAVDRVLELAEYIAPSQQEGDFFSRERRFEQRYPSLVEQLPHFMQGYQRTPESALAILNFIEKHFEVNLAIKEQILRLVNKY